MKVGWCAVAVDYVFVVSVLGSPSIVTKTVYMRTSTSLPCDKIWRQREHDKTGEADKWRQQDRESCVCRVVPKRRTWQMAPIRTWRMWALRTLDLSCVCRLVPVSWSQIWRQESTQKGGVRLACIHRESKNKSHKFTTPPPPLCPSIASTLSPLIIIIHHHKNGQIETNIPQNNSW